MQTRCYRYTIEIAIDQNQMMTHLRWPIRRWIWSGSTRSTTCPGWFCTRTCPVAATTMHRIRKCRVVRRTQSLTVDMRRTISVESDRWAAVGRTADRIYCRTRQCMDEDRNRITAGHTYQRPTRSNGTYTRTIKNSNRKRICWTTRRWNCCMKSSGSKIGRSMKLATTFTARIESSRADDNIEVKQFWWIASLPAYVADIIWTNDRNVDFCPGTQFGRDEEHEWRKWECELKCESSDASSAENGREGQWEDAIARNLDV